MCAGVRPNAVRPWHGVPVEQARGFGDRQRRQGRRLLTIAVQRPHGRTLLLHIDCRARRPSTPLRQSYHTSREPHRHHSLLKSITSTTIIYIL